jgi:predicted transcriptional regulator
MPTVPFSLRLDAEMKTKIDQEAEKLERPASYIVTKAIKEYLDNREYKKRAIDEALKEADKGAFISHESVMTWMESLGTEQELPRPKPDVFSK